MTQKQKKQKQMKLNHLRTASCTYTSAEWHGWAHPRTGTSCTSTQTWVAGLADQIAAGVPQSVPGAEELGSRV